MDISIPKIPSITIQGVTAPTQADITALRIPPAVIAAGVIMLKGTINGRTQNGEAILHTIYGDLFLKSELFLKNGSEIMLQLQHNNNEISAKIVTIDQKSLPKYLEMLNGTTLNHDDIIIRSSFNNEADITENTPSIITQNQPKSALTSVLKAILLNPSLSAEQTLATAKTTTSTISALPFNEIPTNIASPANIYPQQTTNPHAPSQPIPPQGANILPLVELPTPTPETLKLISALPAGSILDLKLISITLPNHLTEQTSINQLANQLANHAANIISAQVISHPDQEDIILHTPVGTMRLLSPTPLPTGTIINISIEHTQTQTPISLPIAPPPHELPDIFRSTEILDLTRPPANAASPNPLHNLSIIPQLGKNFTAELLFFLVALKKNDLSTWIDSTKSEKLKSENPILLEKLTQGLTSLHQHLETKQTNEGVPDGKIWQQYLIPVYIQGEFSQISLYHPKDDQPEKKKSENSSEHFLLEVHLSQLGRLQLDGFVRHSLPKKIFELIIRSETPLTPQNQEDIRAIFQTAQEITGFVGGVSFQTGKQACRNFVEPPKPRENFIIA